MKDKKVINIISKTYFTIVTFFSFILLSFISVFIILQHGLYLKELSFSNITIKNIYIKWNEKLSISIEKLNIEEKKRKREKENRDIKEISNYIKLLSQFFLLTESVAIEKCKYKNSILSLRYTPQEGGFLSAKDPFFSFNSNFKFQNNSLSLFVNDFSALKNNFHMQGKILIDTKVTKVFAKLGFTVNNDTNLTLYAIADKNKIEYKLKANDTIKNIRNLVALFPLPKGVKFWAIDAIDAKSLTIHACRGYFRYNDIASAYKHIYINATLNKLNYTYNKNLDAVHTEKTDIKFLNGILFIRPKKAYSYGTYLDKSWLKIDFTKYQEILTLRLLFNGKLNKNMLHILQTYNIKLPFLQHSGDVKTDLTIMVNLRKITVDAQGSFFTKKANFDYLGLNLDIFNTLIHLNNYKIDIPKMKAKYKNMADANITVKYNAKKGSGDINFYFTKIQIDKNIFLKTEKKPLDVIYKISKDGDKIFIKKSIWEINKTKAEIDSITIPFDLKKLYLNIPTVYFSIENIANGFATGEVNLKTMQSDFNIDLLHFKYQGVKLAQSNAEINLHYNKKLLIKSLDDLFFTLNGSQYIVKKPSFRLIDKQTLLFNSSLKISKYITTKIAAKYNIKKKRATIDLNNFTLVNPKNKNILYYSKKENLLLNANNKKIKISSQKLDAEFLLEDDRWILHLNAIKKLAKNSQFLKKYNITNGKITFYKKEKEKYTKFRGEIPYKYKLLTKKEKNIQKYKFKGYIDKNQDIYIAINKKLNIKIGKEIEIQLQNSGINIEELLKFIELIQKKEKTNKKTNIFFKAKNSYLYLGNKRYIISDRIDLQYYQNILTAQLFYKQGKAGFKLEKNRFHLYGNNFNDKFMENLFSLSKFHGGNLDFSMSGTLKDYSGIFYIKNTTIEDYVVLNNILAFINTVPSLATFSLPGYNKEGLHIDNAYMKFHSKNHIFDISDIYIGSKEIKILGKGKASVKYDNIDLTLNLKTDLGSSVSKIPLVGYIIFDGESISTTLKVTGKLTNPKIESMLARDIAVAPLNIILRTLTLPYKIIKEIKNYNSDK